jgi:hypothetical protein
MVLSAAARLGLKLTVSVVAEYSFKQLISSHFLSFPQTACALPCDGYNGAPLLEGP